MQLEVDVAIIGAGTAGTSAAREVKRATDSFVLINEGSYGTTCARVGCMPSKTLLYYAHQLHKMRQFQQNISPLAPFFKPAGSAILQAVRNLRDQFVENATADYFQHFSTHNIHGKAEFLRPDLLRVGATQILAGKGIIIATGSKPMIPKQWLPLKKYILTSDEIFELKALPDSLAVMGLGLLGLEFSQALARVGVRVAGFEQGSLLGGLTDPVVSLHAQEILSREFEISLAQQPELQEQNGLVRVKTGNKSGLFERVFVSVGRRPSLDGLGLAQFGILNSEGQLLKYNPDTTQVGEFRIFVAGDADGDRPLLHEAALEGKIAGFNSVRAHSEYFQRPAPLSIGFSSPGIAVCGFSYAQAKERNMVCGAADFSSQGRAVLQHENEGLLHLYAEKGSGRVLGAEMFAPGAEHLAHLISWSIQHQSDLDDFLQMPYYHPTLEEGIRIAAKDARHKIAAQHNVGFTIPEGTVHQAAV